MTFASEPLVSVITPVYNEEEYLTQCIESVLAQSYENWDYTIVDNCSTDRSLEIARSYAAKDRRIRVQESRQFLDIIPNHNRAMQQISPDSKYCKVVLGDDWIFPRCLEQMVSAAEAHPSAGVVSAYQKFREQIRITGLPRTETLVLGREACRQFLMDTLFLFGSPTSVMYRADFVRCRQPFYVETTMYPDFECCFEILLKSDLAFVHEILTFSRPRPQSIGAISADIGAKFRSMLDILFTYGPECLTSEEYGESLDRHLSRYYTFLGRRLLVDHDPAFWSYHKTAFETAGIPFSRLRVVRTALLEMCKSIMQPKSTAESIQRLLRSRKIRNQQMRNLVFRVGTNPTVHQNAGEGKHCR
jgi:glycosyltransferase involved in cell wall biosynthesis